jgi:hypothetical protein
VDWDRDDVIDAIRQLKFLASQFRKLQPGTELLMIWWR